MVNDQEKDWQLANKEFCHIFDYKLPAINWTIQPVPQDFVIAVHYEEPIPNTTSSAAYLGQYALVFPLVLRFGSTDTPSYLLYTWFDYGTTVATFTIQPQACLSQINVYSLSDISKIVYSASNSSELFQFKISGNGSQILFQKYSRNGNLAFSDPTLFPEGAVITMNSQTVQSISPTQTVQNNPLNLAVLVVACVIICSY